MGGFSRVNLTNLTLIIGALFEFLSLRLWWWFAPAVSILAVFVAVAIYTQRAAISVTPFIYTVF